MKAIPRTDVPGTWIVVSGPNVYNVDDRDTPTCDCAAHIYTDRPCKHIRLVQECR